MESFKTKFVGTKFFFLFIIIVSIATALSIQSCTSDEIEEAPATLPVDICENVTYLGTVQAIIDRNCSYDDGSTGCHSSNAPVQQGDFTSFQSILNQGVIDENNPRIFIRAVEIQNMPPTFATGPTSLTQEEIEILTCWHNTGYREGSTAQIIIPTTDTIIVTDTVTITDTIEVDMTNVIVMIDNDTISTTSTTVPIIAFCDANPATWDLNVQSIISTYCTGTNGSTPNCHAGPGSNFRGFEDITTFAGFVSEGFNSNLFEQRVIISAGTSNSMPPSFSSGPTMISMAELEILQCWVDAGFPEN